MKALRFTVTCPDCAGEVTQLATGAPSLHQTRCTVACQTCGAEFLVTVALSRTRIGKQIRRAA